MISDNRTPRRPRMKPVVIGGFPGLSRRIVPTLSAYATKKHRSFVGARSALADGIPSPSLSDSAGPSRKTECQRDNRRSRFLAGPPGLVMPS